MCILIANGGVVLAQGFQGSVSLCVPFFILIALMNLRALPDQWKFEHVW